MKLRVTSASARAIVRSHVHGVAFAAHHSSRCSVVNHGKRSCGHRMRCKVTRRAEIVHRTHAGHTPGACWRREKGGECLCDRPLRAADATTCMAPLHPVGSNFPTCTSGAHVMQRSSLASVVAAQTFQLCALAAHAGSTMLVHVRTSSARCAVRYLLESSFLPTVTAEQNRQRGKRRGGTTPCRPHMKFH